MSNKESQVDDKCRACHGTGCAAGARPVRKGPFLLNPPLCRVCGGTGRKPQLRTEDATIPRRAYADVADLDKGQQAGERRSLGVEPIALATSAA